MADEALQRPLSELLRPLEEVGLKRRDGVRRVGRKAFVLSKLARAGLPIPEAWVLDTSHYEEFAARCLPRKHDLRSLIKLSGTKAGDERCARAYDELISATLSDELVEGVHALWEETLSKWPLGVAVRPSLAASGTVHDAAARHLHSRAGLHSAEAILDAAREVWASSTLSHAVAAYAEANVKAVSVALILQATVATEAVGLLTRATSMGEPTADADWHLGVLLGDDHEPLAWQRRAQLLLPASVGKGGEHPAEPLAHLQALLEPDGFEQLADAGREVEKELGPSAVLHFAVTRATPDGTCELAILNADESPRWKALHGGDASTTWVELVLGGSSPEPPMRLSQSVMDRVVDGAVRELLHRLRCEPDDEVTLISAWSGRSYFNLSALAGSLVDVPLLSPEDLLYAVGGTSPERMRALAGRSAATRRRRWRLPMVGASALLEQVKFDSDLGERLRTLEREARGMGDMDPGLLPNDAIATTLTSAQSLLERSAELWAGCASAHLVHLLALRTLVRRRLPDADLQLGYQLTTGVGSPFASAFALAAARTLETVRSDEEVVALLRQVRDGSMPAPRSPRELPDGRPRGALGQLLSTYGDMAFGSLELANPRFREDAGDLFRLLALLIDTPLDGRLVEGHVARAHALADAELARYEPELSALERRLLHALRDRTRALLRQRASVDRLLFRSEWLVRRVVLDIDRRLKRIDASVPAGGAFHCSATRLKNALRSGRPELTRVIHMRQVERRQESLEPAPPLSFTGSPPRGGVPVMLQATLEGVGVSPGVVEGRARVVRGRLPRGIAQGEVLVVTMLDPALSPVCALAGAVVSEVGGALSLGAELARDLALPAVVGVRDAALHIRDGEMLRVDGGRGTVQRLELG